MDKPLVQVVPYPVGGQGWVKFRSEAPSEISEQYSRSWSKTDLDKITGAVIWFAETSVRLDVPDGEHGDFWQSDDFECLVGSTKPTMVRRRLQVRVDNGWFAAEISHDGSVEFQLYETRK
jgi:hypothetical protein